ncbi:MAG TPA: VOC family protein [Chitinophagaceae bacterium]
MAECVPFLQVRNIGQTIKWYEDIGFKCTMTNHLWEPDCELNWARLEWEGAAFMLGPNRRESMPDIRNASLWFNVEAIEQIIKILKGKGISINIEPETFYGRKVVSFRDINGLDVSFSCPLAKT